jgi:hypothetical protein
MYTILNYFIAFWTVVVFNCIQPINWKYCYRVDQWLIPGIGEGLQIYNNPSSIYENERKQLEDINKDIESNL